MTDNTVAEKLTEKSCREFMSLLSSKSPVPGGGGAAAMGGALGVGLANMVASLTQGKKKYAEYEEEITDLLSQGLSIQKDLLHFVEADAEVFAPLAKAYSMPSDTEEEKLHKAIALSNASIYATSVPLLIAEDAVDAMKICARVAVIGSRLAISDAGCSVWFLYAAVKAADYNVQINLPYIRDKVFIARSQKRMEHFLEQAQLYLKQIQETVAQRLSE